MVHRAGFGSSSLGPVVTFAVDSSSLGSAATFAVNSNSLPAATPAAATGSSSLPAATFAVGSNSLPAATSATAVGLSSLGQAATSAATNLNLGLSGQLSGSVPLGSPALSDIIGCASSTPPADPNSFLAPGVPPEFFRLAVESLRHVRSVASLCPDKTAAYESLDKAVSCLLAILMPTVVSNGC